MESTCDIADKVRAPPAQISKVAFDSVVYHRLIKADNSACVFILEHHNSTNQSIEGLRWVWHDEAQWIN